MPFKKLAYVGCWFLVLNFFYLHNGGWNQGPLDTAAT
jgi:hypothetical protein